MKRLRKGKAVLRERASESRNERSELNNLIYCKEGKKEIRKSSQKRTPPSLKLTEPNPPASLHFGESTHEIEAEEEDMFVKGFHAGLGQANTAEHKPNSKASEGSGPYT